jgi:hypothetical protein
MTPEHSALHTTPEPAPPPPAAAAQDRLAKIADLLGPCPPPDMASGNDQCAHGTWPCVITQAAWLAQGRDRDQEVQAACRAAAWEAEAEHNSWEACQELLAAEEEGRLPYWEVEAEPGAG